jgi:16S rRNA G966 N2-methylase RsmD
MKMDQNLIKQKFGNYYSANEDTYRLGMNIKFTDHLAKRFVGKTVLETCSGGGFTTISLAKYAKHVYSFEIDQNRIEDAKQNCEKAGFTENITFINDDVFSVFKMDIKNDINSAYIDPDWDNFAENYVFRFHDSMTKPKSDFILYEILKITNNITLIQPPYISKNEFDDLANHEIEELYIANELAVFALHFGELIKKSGETKFKI